MDKLMMWICVTLSVVCLSSLSGAKKNTTPKAIADERRLFKEVFDVIDPKVRPVINWTDAMQIKLDFIPLYMKSLDEPNQVFQIYSWIALEWFDPQLVWDPADYGGVDFVAVKATEIWAPDVGIINSAIHLYNDVFEPEKYRAVVRRNGIVRVAYSGDLHSICILDHTYFPFDYQVCHVEFDSWTLDTSKGKFSNESSLVTANLRENGLWDVVDSWRQFSEDDYLGEIFRTISFTFLLRRKPSFVLFNIALPVFVLFTLEILVFLIPVEAGEKISLGITLMLAITVFQLVIADNLPVSSEYFPLLSLYLVGVMVLSAIALMFTVCVIHIHHRDPEHSRVPRWVRRLFLGRLQRLLCVTMKYQPDLTSEGDEDDVTRRENHHGQNENDSFIKPGEDETNEWILVARVFDRLFLYTYILLMVCLTCGTFLTCLDESDDDVNRSPLGGYGYTPQTNQHHTPADHAVNTS